jgi:hypothetical protein
MPHADSEAKPLRHQRRKKPGIFVAASRRDLFRSRRVILCDSSTFRTLPDQLATDPAGIIREPERHAGLGALEVTLTPPCSAESDVERIRDRLPVRIRHAAATVWVLQLAQCDLHNDVM